MEQGAQISERRAASPQSVTRVIRLLEVLCASSEPVSLADLSRRLATPKSSLAALLRGLADEGFVLEIPFQSIVIFLILAALAGVLAAIPPARRASRLDVLEALAYE